MKITNKTKWSTRDLQAFFRRVAKEELEPEHLKRLRVTVTYTRPGRRTGEARRYAAGYAYLRSATMKLKIPAHDVDKVAMACVIAHEMAHCRGLEHGSAMRSSRYYQIGNWRERYAWAERLPLREAKAVSTAKPKVKPARPVGSAADQLKLAKASAKLEQWDRKLKAVAARRKTWERKVKYYERKLAKAASKAPASACEPCAKCI